MQLTRLIEIFEGLGVLQGCRGCPQEVQVGQKGYFDARGYFIAI